MKIIKMASALAVVSVFSMQAQAQEVYGGIGLHGVTAGYSHYLSDNLTVRGDLTGGLKYSATGREAGLEYDGTYKGQSFGAYGDWFPFSNSFRLTGGVNINSRKLTLKTTGNGTATIDGIPVNLSNSYLHAQAELSKVTPYLGIGWGHKQSNQKGWGFFADVGVMFGKFKINRIDQNITANFPGIVSQANIDNEVASAQKEINKVKVVPVVKVGVTYRF